jgi:hypothetical protein
MAAGDQDRRRRQKNIALALILVAFATLFYVLTLVKLGAPG